MVQAKHLFFVCVYEHYILFKHSNVTAIIYIVAFEMYDRKRD